MSNFIRLLNNKKCVLVDFHTTWCSPCKVMSQVIKEVKNTFTNKVEVVRIDIDINEHIISRYNVKSLPTLVLFIDGEEVWRKTGVTEVGSIVNTIQGFIK